MKRNRGGGGEKAEMGGDEVEKGLGVEEEREHKYDRGRKKQ